MELKLQLACLWKVETKGKGAWGEGVTNVRPFLLVSAIQKLVQHLGSGSGLDGDAGQQTLVVDIADEVAGVRLRVGGVGGGLGGLGGAREGRLVVETVQVAAGLLELLDPLLGLFVFFPLGSAGCGGKKKNPPTHLGDHHVAVKGAAAVPGGGLIDVFPDLGDDGGAEGDVRYEVAVPMYPSRQTSPQSRR